MDLTFSEQETAFRDELRGWLAENQPDPKPTEAGEDGRSEGLVEAVGGEDIGEGEAALLEELATEGVDLMAEVAVGGQSHRSAPGW